MDELVPNESVASERKVMSLGEISDDIPRREIELVLEGLDDLPKINRTLYICRNIDRSCG